MSRRWKILLITSLALNLFLVGAVATRLIWLWRAEHPAADPALRALAPQQREVFLGVVRRVVDENRPLSRQIRAVRQSASRRFAEDPYDPAGAAAELERASALELQLRRNIEGAILAHGRGLSAAERQALAPVLERGLRRIRMNHRPGERDRRPTEERR